MEGWLRTLTPNLIDKRATVCMVGSRFWKRSLSKDIHSHAAQGSHHLFVPFSRRFEKWCANLPSWRVGICAQINKQADLAQVSACSCHLLAVFGRPLLVLLLIVRYYTYIIVLLMFLFFTVYMACIHIMRGR